MKLKEEYKGCVIGKRINGKLIEFDTNKGNYEWYFKNGFREYFEESIKKKVIKYVGIKQDSGNDSRDLDAEQEENS